MWLIAGIGAAASAALLWWRRTSRSHSAGYTVSTLRQQTGVLAALVNMVNAVLDALTLVRRVSAGAPSGGLSFGSRVRDSEDE